jgi:S1-C subfamily serine protease
VILAVGGRAIGGQADFYRSLWASGTAGVEISLQVWRNKAVEEIRISSMDRLEYLGVRPSPAH